MSRFARTRAGTVNSRTCTSCPAATSSTDGPAIDRGRAWRAPGPWWEKPVTRYNRYDGRSPAWKVKAAVGALVLAGGVVGGVALTHQSATIHDSAFQFGFGENGNGAMLDSAMNGLSAPGISPFMRTRSLQELGAFRGFGGQFGFWHHHSFSRLAFERGQVVFITHHFLIVRSLDGRLTVWRLTGGTAVKDVMPTAMAPAPMPTSATSSPTATVPGATPTTTPPTMTPPT